MRKLLALIRLGRPHFLLGGVIFYGLGVAMAVYAGAALRLDALLLGQLAVTATQWMTHYANDTFDLEADRANRSPTAWSGGSRVLVRGLIRPTTALRIALIMAGIALGTNVILSVFIRPGIATFALLLLAQALAWFYSAPLLRLHSRGLGEFTASITVPLLTPLLGFYLQAGIVTLLPILAALPLCCLQFAMLLAIEFPDAAGDAAAGKGTLVVRYGPVAMARLYALLLLMTYALLPLLYRLGLPLQVTQVVAALSPLAGWQIWRVWRGDWRDASRWGWLAFFSIVLLMGTALAEGLAFVVLTLQTIPEFSK